MAGGLSEEELDELLRETIVGRLATIDAEGYPHIVPVWTYWDGRQVFLVARAKATYVENLRSRPRVALSIVRSDAADTRALIQGDAEIVDGPGPLEGRMLDIARDMAVRYEGPEGLDYIGESHDWPRVLVVITPRSVVTWGDPDWHPRYRS
jgi:PPOX class probable F420-dependent enzyme